MWLIVFPQGEVQLYLPLNDDVNPNCKSNNNNNDKETKILHKPGHEKY